MPKDFKASQIRTSKIVVSGSEEGKPALLIYSASDASNFSGGFQSNMLDDVGTDVFIFVSGSKTRNNENPGRREGVTLFGGDVVVSGTMFMENLIAEVDMTSTGSASISGSLFVSASLNVGAGLTVNSGSGASFDNKFVVKGSTDSRELITARPDINVVTILSGGASTGTTTNQVASTDTSFFLSGAIRSRNTTTRGTSVIGGDTVISGSLVVGNKLTGFVGSPNIKLDGAGGYGLIGPLDNANTFFRVSDSTGDALSGEVTIQNDGNQNLQMLRDRVWFNTQQRGVDFRVSSDNKANAIYVSGNLDQVLILSGGAKGSANEATASDVAFYVSGTVGSSGTSNRGTTLLGGDTVVSGTLLVMN